MATNIETDHIHLDLDFIEDDSDSDSVRSLETDDGTVHEIEKILAEITGKHNHVWYLVKWAGTSWVRSSWECIVIFNDTPEILDEWKREKQRQAEGKSKPLDIAAFNKAVLEVELAERQRRKLRRLRKQAQSVLTAITAT
jgi:hypothetical protein